MLKFEIQSDGPDIAVNLSGDISEESIFPELNLPIIGALTINLEHVTMINSTGSRKWAVWLRNLKAAGGIRLVKCSLVFVHQMNILYGLIAGATVSSLFIAYYCVSCGASKNQLVEIPLGANKADDLNIPDEIDCPKCGKKMEIDVTKDRFLSFLSRADG